jgi:predicted naringenin-chalcone synthase
MAFVVSAAKSMAEYYYEQEDVEPWLVGWLSKHGKSPKTALRMCRNAQVAARSSILPIEDIFRPKSLTECSQIYKERSIEQGVRVSRAVIERAGLSPKDIDMIIAVSCTGFMIPSVDAYLINEIGMRPDTKRLPITEMGCAAGAVGLSRAREYLKGFPEHNVLLLSVELPTLTFQLDDLSMDNIVSTAIFGDGAAAALLCGSPRGKAPRLTDSRTFSIPGSTHLMGFDLGDEGFRIRLSKEIPEAVRTRVRPILDDFLAQNGMILDEVSHLIFHPGGKRILEVYRDELGISEDSLHFSHKVLRECGNVSSATVLMVLEEIMRNGETQKGDTGLVLAMGPGFSIEQLLIRWEG